MRKAARVILIIGFATSISILLIGWRYPVFFKWLSGTGKCIGKPIKTKVYINSILNNHTSVFKVDTYYLVHFNNADQFSRVRFLSIHKDRSVIGLPSAVGKRDYDIIGGYLFQSETGSKFSDIRDDIKGFDFDPGLSFAEKSIHFRIPAANNDTGSDSIRIEL